MKATPAENPTVQQIHREPKSSDQFRSLSLVVMVLIVMKNQKPKSSAVEEQSDIDDSLAEERVSRYYHNFSGLTSDEQCTA
ncbi:hypothetical protein LIER_16945 [Lithospermum erythrorhizon]|uniref:Uncharacterized protein n=1 Tax=Lithospermum erythrorhizon TaxID=34254 RepID=A0AAV3QDX5_LITER